MKNEPAQRDRAWRAHPETLRLRLVAWAREAGYKPSQLAALCGVSVRQLERDCRRLFGCGPRQWLKQQRLARAREALLAKRHVGRAARALGYSHATNFSRDFTRAFGQTPGQFLRDAAARQVDGKERPPLG